MTTINNDISKDILSKLKATGLSCRQIAERCGVSFSTIYALERGKGKPRDGLGEKLLEAYFARAQEVKEIRKKLEECDRILAS